MAAKKSDPECQGETNLTVHESSTHQKQVEEELHAAKIFAESIVETLHEPLLVLNPDLTVKSINPAFHEHFKVNEAETIGCRIYDLGNGQWNIPALRKLLEDVLPDSKVFNDFEVRHRFEDIGERVMLLNARRLDHVQLVLLGIRDITERKKYEEALQQARDELEQRVADRTGELRDSEQRLRGLALELTQTEQRERRQLSLVLHDHLQQLILGAQMHFGLAAQEAERAELRELLQKGLEVIGEALQTCRTLAVELSPPVLHDQGLGAALGWLAGRMQESHRLTVDVSVEESADLDGEELREMLFHSARELLLNVVKHAGADHVQVRLAREDARRICLEVIDNGGGFDPGAPDIAERSRQSFGLFHIRERMLSVGGDLEIESAPGRGTRVRLLVPEEIAPHPPGPQIAAAAKSSPPQRDGDSAIRILVVDDHAIVRAGLISLLSRQPSFDVIGEAVDGKQAVEIARDLEPDVVLMDVTLPVMNGLAATKQIAATLPHVRVIGLSAHAASDMAAAMLEAGAVRYVPKGGPPDELIEAIRDVLSPRPE